MSFTPREKLAVARHEVCAAHEAGLSTQLSVGRPTLRTFRALRCARIYLFPFPELITKLVDASDRFLDIRFGREHAAVLLYCLYNNGPQSVVLVGCGCEDKPNRSSEMRARPCTRNCVSELGFRAILERLDVVFGAEGVHFGMHDDVVIACGRPDGGGG